MRNELEKGTSLPPTIIPWDRPEYWIAAIITTAASAKETPAFESKMVNGKEKKVRAKKPSLKTIRRQAQAFNRIKRTLRQMGNYMTHRQRIQDAIARSQPE